MIRITRHPCRSFSKILRLNTWGSVGSVTFIIWLLAIFVWASRLCTSDLEHFAFEFAKFALDSLDSTVITQTFWITAQSLKVLPNSFPPAVQTSSCYTYTRILRLIFVSRIHARLFLSCTKKIAKVGSAPWDMFYELPYSLEAVMPICLKLGSNTKGAFRQRVLEHRWHVVEIMLCLSIVMIIVLPPTMIDLYTIQMHSYF
jgi:hypothetical protein